MGQPPQMGGQDQQQQNSQASAIAPNEVVYVPHTNPDGTVRI